MFLTNIFFRKGNPGKYRRPRSVTWQMKRSMIKRLEIEAEKEYCLSRPYMTKEQKYSHAAERRQKEWEARRNSHVANFPSHKCLQDHLDHLSVTKKCQCLD
ncbi:hypothetical protein XELAEV_18026194mg [Xenopus laevis]|uniref:Uncharacterized protein n=1 Tax=Xenopus laevis TaxID=8355 RepID=A0A974HJ26_XENLA|nr:hypothetical protein XELAEV_18026194mg [Xenopus laevis]